jgi:hypothetical protein
MGALLEHLLTRGGTAIARIYLQGAGRVPPLRTDPVDVVGYPGGTIDYINGHRRAVPGPLARSGLIDYTPVWAVDAGVEGEEVFGIFDLIRAGSGYQVIWSSGERQKDGTPDPPKPLRTTEYNPDTYFGHGDGLSLSVTVRLVSVTGNIDVDLDLDEGLRNRLGG